MIYRILNSVVSGCILLLVGACQQATRDVPITYKQDFLIDTSVVVKTYATGDLAQPKSIERIGDRVLAFGGYDEVGIYNYPGLEFISKTTIPSAASTTLGDGCIYRESGGHVDTYVLENDSLYVTSSFEIAKAPQTIGTVQELSPGVFIYPDRYDFSGMREFHIMDINHRTCISKGNYPEDERRFKRLDDFKLSYSHSIEVKPDKSAFVVVYGALRRIRIYDKDGELQHDVFLEGSLGNYKVIPTRFSEQYWHFLKGVATDNYIYLINLDRLGVAPMVSRSNILVLDWRGNLIAKYRLDVSVNDIFIDEERNAICGSCWEQENGVVFFEMNMLHNKL